MNNKQKHPQAGAPHSASPKCLRFVFYGRVSTALQAERETIEHQNYAAVQHQKAHDYTFQEFYNDPDVCGVLPFQKRPDGRRLITDARAKRFDVLVVYSISRLARSTLVALGIVKWLKEEFGISFMSIKEPFDTCTPAGWLAFTNMAAIYEFERESILERTQQGKQSLLRAGLLPDGKTRYGWRRENVDRRNRRRDEARLVLHEDEAPVVRDIFRMFVRERLGSNFIADLLNARDVPPPMAGKRQKRKLKGVWHTTTVRHILHDESYVTGEIPYNRTRRIRREGEVIGKEANDEDQWVWIEAPPIVDRATWELAQERFRERQKHTPEGMRRYLLSGKFTCLECQRRGLDHGFSGRTVSRVRKDGERREHSYYTCVSQWKPERCGTPSLRARNVETQVWQQIRHLLLHADQYLAEALDEWNARQESQDSAKSPEEDLAHVEAKLSELAGECERIAEMVRTGFRTQEEEAPNMRRVRAEQSRLKAIRDDLLIKSQAVSQSAQDGALDVIREWLGKLARALDTAENDEEAKEGLVRRLLHRVEVDGKRADAVYEFEPLSVPAECCNENRNMHMLRFRLQVRRPLEIAA